MLVVYEGLGCRQGVPRSGWERTFNALPPAGDTNRSRVSAMQPGQSTALLCENMHMLVLSRPERL